MILYTQRWISSLQEKIEKRMMRTEAAEALEKLFPAAEKQNLHLAGVSAYRSHQTQQSLFDNYVSQRRIRES